MPLLLGDSNMALSHFLWPWVARGRADGVRSAQWDWDAAKGWKVCEQGVVWSPPLMWNLLDDCHNELQTEYKNTYGGKSKMILQAKDIFREEKKPKISWTAFNKNMFSNICLFALHSVPPAFSGGKGVTWSPSATQQMTSQRTGSRWHQMHINQVTSPILNRFWIRWH